MAEQPTFQVSSGRRKYRGPPLRPGEQQEAHPIFRGDSIDRNSFDKLIMAIEHLAGTEHEITKPGVVALWSALRQEIMAGKTTDTLISIATAAPRYGISQDAVMEVGHEHEVADAIIAAANTHTATIAALHTLAVMPPAYGSEPDGLHRWLDENAVESGFAPTQSVDAIRSTLASNADFYARLGETKLSDAIRNTISEVDSGSEPESVARSAAVAFLDEALSSRLSDPNYGSRLLDTLVRELSGVSISASDAPRSWRTTHQWFGDHMSGMTAGLSGVTEFDLNRTEQYRGALRAFPETRLARPEVLGTVSRDISSVRPELGTELYEFANQIAMVMDNNPTAIMRFKDFASWRIATESAMENIHTENLRFTGISRDPKEQGKWYNPGTYVRNIPAWIAPYRNMVQEWRKDSAYPSSVIMPALMGVPDLYTTHIAASGLAGHVDQDDLRKLIQDKLRKSPIGAVKAIATGGKYDRQFGEYMSHYPGLSRGAGGHLGDKSEIAAGFLEMMATIAMFEGVGAAGVPGVQQFGQAQMLSMGPDDWAVMGPLMSINRGLGAAKMRAMKPGSSLAPLAPFLPSRLPRPVEYGSIPAMQYFSQPSDDKPLVEKPPTESTSYRPPPMTQTAR